MKTINQCNLRNVVGGLPLAIKICQTDKIVTPPNLDTGDNVMKGLTTVTGQPAFQNGFQGIDVGVSAGSAFVPIGAYNLCE